MSTQLPALAVSSATVPTGGSLTLEVKRPDPTVPCAVVWSSEGGEFEGVQHFTDKNDVDRAIQHYRAQQPVTATWRASGLFPGKYAITAEIYDRAATRHVMQNYSATGFAPTSPPITTTVQVTDAPKPPVTVTMRRAEVVPTPDQALWTAIRTSTSALGFNNYAKFMDIVLAGGFDDSGLDPAKTRFPISHRLRLPFPDTDAYRQLKVATEVFMMVKCGVFLSAFVDARSGMSTQLGMLENSENLGAERRRYYDQDLQWTDINDRLNQLLGGLTENGTPVPALPYLAIIRRKLGDVSVVSPTNSKWLEADENAVACLGILMTKLTKPCLLELIWSYWHEEGMLVQTMNAITRRFQNQRGPVDRDPLAFLEIDPLRPLNNFIWGYIQDEQHRLTVPRRAYEYDHQYGLMLLGKAVPTARVADSRSRFLEGFHNLLFRCSLFYKEDDDTTVVADGFPVLNALKEVHLLLTQGAHNQYGDLPWTARQEMLMQEWLLARPEFREFLPSRIMVDYPEPWMDRVETMKTMQGWTNTSILHFRDLGVFGEQILLGVRFSPWPSTIEPQYAANWARYWRPEIQGYIHAYRAVTSVDLTERVDATVPSLLLQRRLAPAPVVVAPFVSRVGQLPPPREAR